MERDIRKHSGSKYVRLIHPAAEFNQSPILVDVYCVLDAYPCSAPVGHAVKKLLCMGIRGKGDALQDLQEARDAITRAIQLEEQRLGVEAKKEMSAHFCKFERRTGKCRICNTPVSGLPRGVVVEYEDGGKDEPLPTP